MVALLTLMALKRPQGKMFVLVLAVHSCSVAVYSFHGQGTRSTALP